MARREQYVLGSIVEPLAARQITIATKEFDVGNLVSGAKSPRNCEYRTNPMSPMTTIVTRPTVLYGGPRRGSTILRPLGMAARERADPAKTRQAVSAIADWLRDESRPAPERDGLATAVRLTARTLAAVAPGGSVEVRIPPFAAVQCISGPRHTRGTPPNVVETDPRTWLLLATGLLRLQEAKATGALTLSGSRAGEIERWLPLIAVS
jgi:hypothetical protein